MTVRNYRGTPKQSILIPVRKRDAETIGEIFDDFLDKK